MKDRPNVTVYDNGGKTADRFTVLIGDDVFAMSSDANMPNGVCMYIGSASDFEDIPDRECQYFSRLPVRVQRQIEHIENENKDE
mgnify:FL=1